MFKDEATIRVKAGDGGRGCISFRREKFVAKGGPNGGDGGAGGDVWVIASNRLNTLYHLQFNREWKAERGEHGMGSNCTGRAGHDETIELPVGSVVRDLDTGMVLADLIPMMAERICGICGCVHNVAYAQAVESAVALRPPPRAEYIRTIMLEIERLHSHLLWVGLACHIVGFDTLFMQSWRIREPIMWIAEKISGNRKTYALCVIGGVRWDITAEVKAELRQVLDKLEAEWHAVVAAVCEDKNIQKRTRSVGVADMALVKNAGLIGPVARAAGADIDCRRDHPYAAYDRVDFDFPEQPFIQP